MAIAAPAGVAPLPAAAGAWSADLPAAQARAKAEGKYVLIHFSGSDWCGWCMKLRKEVFLKPDFIAYAQSNLLLVTIDFPKHKPVPSTQQAANQRLAEQFQVQGFPTLVLLDSQGRRVGNVNYAQGGPKVFMAELEKLIRPPREVPPPSKAPAPKAIPTRKGAKAETADTRLTLRAISGRKQQRRAVINGVRLSAGGSATVTLATGPVQVRCVEIRDRSVVITINGKERVELKLPG